MFLGVHEKDKRMHLAVKLRRIKGVEVGERGCRCVIDLLTQPPLQRMEENPPAMEMLSTWEPGGGPAIGEPGDQHGHGPGLARYALADAALTHVAKVWGLSSQRSGCTRPCYSKT